MVEYALLIAGSAIGPIVARVNQFVADFDWHVAAYLGLALLALRIAFWAFKITS